MGKGRNSRELSAIEVSRLVEPGRYRVGRVSGLTLYIAPAGTRSWVLRTMVGGQRKDIGLGRYPEISLAKARERAEAAKDKILAGIDPVQERKALRQALIDQQLQSLTFEQAAQRCHAAKSQEFKNDKHSKQWLSTLEHYAYPVIGRLPIETIALPHILKVLEPIWKEKTETATRVRQRLEAVIAWATVSGYRSGDNPARWVGNLKEVLPTPNKIKKVRHHPSVNWKTMAGFMRELAAMPGLAPRALEFAILTAARSGEVRGMAWDEVDFKAKLWTVPAERMKGNKKHRVPLSLPALNILKALPVREDSQYVFPALRGGMLSDTALLAVMQRMGLKEVPHGFRSSFKDWARNRGGQADEVSELALAHVNNDATRAAYARDELLPQRTELMKQWAAFCIKGRPTHAKGGK